MQLTVIQIIQDFNLYINLYILTYSLLTYRLKIIKLSYRCCKVGELFYFTVVISEPKMANLLDRLGKHLGKHIPGQSSLSLQTVCLVFYS